MAAITMQSAMNCRPRASASGVWLNWGCPPASCSKAQAAARWRPRQARSEWRSSYSISMAGSPSALGSQRLPGTLVARRDGVERARRQDAAQQRRSVGRQSDIITGLWACGFPARARAWRDRLRPELEGLARRPPRAARCGRDRSRDGASLPGRYCGDRPRAHARGSGWRSGPARSGHFDAGRGKLHAERIGKRLDGEFRGAIGAAIRRRDEARAPRSRTRCVPRLAPASPG